MKQKSLQETAPPADLENVANRTESISRLSEAAALSLSLKDEKAALQILMQALNIPPSGASKEDSDRLIAALGVLMEIGPKGALESLLAVQMMGVHNAALMFLRNATVDGQDIEMRDANVLRSVRLMRLLVEQLEAMARLKGNAREQKVTVEHVHVYEGGHAIVGAVTGKEGAPKRERCSEASQSSQTRLAALSRMGILLAIYQGPCDVAQGLEGGNAVSGACNAKWTLPNAWRCVHRTKNSRGA